MWPGRRRDAKRQRVTRPHERCGKPFSGRPPKRNRTFQKILDHRGIVGADPIGVVAHLQLGRTLALAGDTVKAKLAYGDFLTLWKDADSDIPILVQAKAEYARLP
jgi:hypothetical protein